MVNKYSDRSKYNPDGKNDYSTPKEKPPRYDLRRKHKVVDDPLDKKDRKLEENMKDGSLEELNNMDLELVKKIAKKRIKTAGRPPLKEMSLQREGLDNFQFKEDGIRAIAKTYKSLADSFLCMTKAVNSFTSCKSSEVSPDGKLGGKGYIQTVKDVRSAMSECLNLMSELLDTFHDEVNSPYWKKTTVEDHPVVKEILNSANEAINQAEKIEEPKANDPEKIVLSDEEKNKVVSILKSKGHF